MTLDEIAEIDSGDEAPVDHFPKPPATPSARQQQRRRPSSGSCNSGVPESTGVDDDSKPMAKAVFAWNSAAGAAVGDLHFEEGDLIEITGPDEPGEGWITGRRVLDLPDSIPGIFPANYVEMLPGQSRSQATTVEDHCIDAQQDQIRMLPAPRLQPTPPPSDPAPAAFPSGYGGNQSHEQQHGHPLAPAVPAPPLGSMRPPRTPGAGGGFVRRRAFPSNAIKSRPAVISTYNPGEDQYMLTSRETALVVVLQSHVRGANVRARLRRGWVAAWQARTHERANRAKRKLLMHSLVIGRIQMNRGRYRRRLKRERRKKAKAEEAAAGGDDHGKMPAWFKFVAWGSCIAWCVLTGFYTFILGLTFGPTATLEWLLGGYAMLSYEAIVQDTFKIGMTVVFSENAEFLVDLYYEFMDFMPFEI
eukprot:SAG31_NODE_4822_length_2929_cov_2.447350_1_plen_417_part_00